MGPPPKGEGGLSSVCLLGPSFSLLPLLLLLLLKIEKKRGGPPCPWAVETSLVLGQKPVLIFGSGVCAQVAALGCFAVRSNPRRWFVLVADGWGPVLGRAG